MGETKTRLRNSISRIFNLEKSLDMTVTLICDPRSFNVALILLRLKLGHHKADAIGVTARQ